MKRNPVLLLTILVGPAMLWAIDGQVLINQATVMAAGGFPYVISQPGSYKLSGNLTVPSGSTAIEIKSPNVTVDLNGFSISTPVQGQYPGVTGILFVGPAVPTRLVIRNGSVEGFTAPLGLAIAENFFLHGCQYCVLEDLVLRWGLPGGASSLDLGNFMRIHRVTAPDNDINVFCPAVVSETVARSVNQAISFGGPGPTPSAGACTFTNNATLQ